MVHLAILKEQTVNIHDLPKYCDNGILTADIINRLEGREEVIKGITRVNYTKVQKLININKSLDFLKNYEKMNPRHLWDANLIEEGNHQVIWELLFDIWNFYTNRQRQSKEKTSKNQKKINKNNKNDTKSFNQREEYLQIDTKYEENCIKLSRDRLMNHYSDFNKYKKAVNNQMKSNNDSCNNRTLSHSTEKATKVKQQHSNMNLSFSNEKNFVNNSKIHMDNTLVSGKSSIQYKDDKSPISMRTSKFNQSDSLGLSYSSIRERSLERRKQFLPKGKQTINNNENYRFRQEDEAIQKCLSELGIHLEAKIDFSKDTIDDFKDGLLLCCIVSKLEGIKINGINMNPRDNTSYISNVRRCLEVLRKKKEISLEFLWSEEDIIRGDGKVIRNLLHQIFKSYRKLSRSSFKSKGSRSPSAG